MGHFFIHLSAIFQSFTSGDYFPIEPVFYL